MLLASKRQRSRVPAKIPWCTGQPPRTKNLAPNVKKAAADSPGLSGSAWSWAGTSRSCAHCKLPAATGKPLPILLLILLLSLTQAYSPSEEFNKSLDVWVFTPSRPLAVDSGCYISQNFSGPIFSSVKQKAWKRWLRSSSSSQILFEMLSVLIMSQRERIQLSMHIHPWRTEVLLL